jgi:hypothetical protein
MPHAKGKKYAEEGADSEGIRFPVGRYSIAAEHFHR